MSNDKNTNLQAAPEETPEEVKSRIPRIDKKVVKTVAVSFTAGMAVATFLLKMSGPTRPDSPDASEMETIEVDTPVND